MDGIPHQLETPVLVRAEWTIEGKKRAWTALAMREDGKTHEEDSSFAGAKMDGFLK